MAAVNAYGEADPCPNCGSHNVRWRRRRFSDVILTYLRYFIDTMAGTVFGAGGTSVAGSSVSERATEARVEGMEYKEARRIYEDRAGTATANRFWKCHDCHQKGQVFDHIDTILSDRERLVGMEGDIEQNLGAVIDPIGSDSPRSD